MAPSSEALDLKISKIGQPNGLPAKIQHPIK